jgi:hypothetical protein
MHFSNESRKRKTIFSWPLTLIMQKRDHFRHLRHHYSESPVIPLSNDIWYRCVAPWVHYILFFDFLPLVYIMCLFVNSGVQRILCSFSSSCVPYVVSFSGLSILDCPLVFSNVYLKRLTYELNRNLVCNSAILSGNIAHQTYSRWFPDMTNLIFT